MNQVASRTKNSLRNVIFGLGGLIISQLITFVTKSVFVRLLGAEYNGVNGLFTNILQVLNLAELGFATSVAYALYKPIQEKDEYKQAALMNYFAKAYRIIAVVVAIAGCCCIPFLQYLIAEDISGLPFSLNQLRCYFAMFLANTVCSYLLAYKRTIITADQNNYIISNVDNACNIVLNIVQIILLLIYNNYYAYLATMIVKTLLNNIILQIIANKKYPYLIKNKKAKLELQEKRSIIKNVEASFLHRLSVVASNGTASIIISAVVGLVAAGKYSNYLMICSSVNMVIDIVFNSITASIGNLCASETVEAQFKVYKKVRYLAYFCGTFTLVCYIALFNSFIEFWVGSEMIMETAVVVAISFNASKWYFRKGVTVFKDAKGMFRDDWFKPILETIIGIGLSVGLSYVIGVLGVMLGQIIATMFIGIPIETFVLFKKGFNKSLTAQFIGLLAALLFAFALAALTYFIASFIPSGVGWFVLRFVFVVVFAAGVFILATCRTEEFKYYKNLAMTIIKKIVGKIKVKLGKKQPAEVFPAIDANEQSVEQNVGDENGSKEGVEQEKEDAENCDSEKSENVQSVDNDKQNDGGGDGE